MAQKCNYVILRIKVDVTRKQVKFRATSAIAELLVILFHNARVDFLNRFSITMGTVADAIRLLF